MMYWATTWWCSLILMLVATSMMYYQQEQNQFVSLIAREQQDFTLTQSVYQYLRNVVLSCEDIRNELYSNTFYTCVAQHPFYKELDFNCCIALQGATTVFEINGTTYHCLTAEL